MSTKQTGQLYIPASRRGGHTGLAEVWTDGGPWTPAAVSGLQFWQKPEYLLSYGDGDGIGVWAGANATVAAKQATTGNQPVCKLNIVNGYPVARFTKASNHYFGINYTPASPMTWFMVVKLSALDATNQCLMTCHKVATPCGGFVTFTYNTSGTQNKLAIQAGKGGAWNDGLNFAPETTALTTNWQVHVFQFAANNFKYYVDSTTPVATDTSALASAITAGRTVGIGYNIDSGVGVNQFGGDMAEWALWNVALSDADVVSLIGYCRSKYNF